MCHTTALRFFVYQPMLRSLLSSMALSNHVIASCKGPIGSVWAASPQLFENYAVVVDQMHRWLRLTAHALSRPPLLRSCVFAVNMTQVNVEYDSETLRVKGKRSENG